MENDLKPYFFNDYPIRYNDGKNPQFMLADLCKALNMSNPSMAKNVIFEEYREEKVHFIGHNGRLIEATAVNEAGMFQLIMRSNKPEAVKFQKYVFEVLLPGVRRKQFFKELEEKEGTELGKSFARIMAER